MVAVIEHRIEAVETGRPQGPPRLSVVPILGKSHRVPAYRVLDGQTQKRVEISEINESGSVPVLRVHNGTDQRLYLMDGQELVGAKQNRILNADVLVPAGSTLEIPVSCVEQGRWHYKSRRFAPGKSASHAVRLQKSLRVHESLKARRGHNANQGEVWQNVSASIERAQATSPTESLADAYTARQAELDAFRRDLTLPRRTIGLAVFGGGQLLGIDLFDRHRTLIHFWTSLLDGYAIERLHEPLDPESGTAAVSDLPRESLRRQAADALSDVADGKWEAFDAPGEGADQRLEDKKFSGSALVWEDRVVVHLQVFPKPGSDKPRRRGEGGDRVGTRVRRPDGRSGQHPDQEEERTG